MNARAIVMAAALAVVSGPVSAVELPKDVTPEIRVACEKDVRRLCIRSNSTVETVKACVKRKFRKLNPTCRVRLVRAGF